MGTVTTGSAPTFCCNGFPTPSPYANQRDDRDDASAGAPSGARRDVGTSTSPTRYLPSPRDLSNRFPPTAIEMEGHRLLAIEVRSHRHRRHHGAARTVHRVGRRRRRRLQRCAPVSAGKGAHGGISNPGSPHSIRSPHCNREAVVRPDTRTRDLPDDPAIIERTPRVPAQRTPAPRRNRRAHVSTSTRSPRCTRDHPQTSARSGTAPSHFYRRRPADSSIGGRSLRAGSFDDYLATWIGVGCRNDPARTRIHPRLLVRSAALERRRRQRVVSGRACRGSAPCSSCTADCVTPATHTTAVPDWRVRVYHDDGCGDRGDLVTSTGPTAPRSKG